MSRERMHGAWTFSSVRRAHRGGTRFCFPAAVFTFLALAALCLSCATGPLEPLAAAQNGLTTATRTFEFHYRATVPEVPESARTAYLWIPYPPDNEDQTIRDLRVVGSLASEVVTEPEYGNRAIRFELPPGTSGEEVGLSFQVTRLERVRRPGQVNAASLHSSAEDSPEQWLGPDRRVPLDDHISALARQTVEGHDTRLRKARAIYDHVVTNLKYEKTGTGWGQGDIYWACDAKYGNCTDFHSVFIGFARSEGIPARFEMGFPIPPDRGEGEVAGYHCWAQFYMDGDGWIPLDASEANKHPEKREYFWGAHDENRVLFTLGRDLTFPGMQADPLNFFIYPYVEVDGEPADGVERRFTYRDVEA